MNEIDIQPEPGSKRRSGSSLLMLIIALLGLAALSGYLLSQASLAGRTGIHLFYREYRFLQTWWQGGSIIFIVWLVLTGLLALNNQRPSGSKVIFVPLLFLVLGALGLFLTFRDFTKVMSHRLLGERFHLGAYLFWIGWMIICFYYALRCRQRTSVHHV